MTYLNQPLLNLDTSGNAVIKLVQNNTRPALIVTIKDAVTNAPIDVAGSTIILRFKQVGANTVKDTIVGTLLQGLENVDGTINHDTPYDTPGKGGRVSFNWNTNTLDTAGEFQGEFQVTFSDSTIQTVYDVKSFTVRSKL